MEIGKGRGNISRARRCILLTLSTAAVLTGCVVHEEVRTPPPPLPRSSYVPPPPAPAEVAVVDVEVRATVPPPPLPDYDQPPCPEDGYIWTPGYWHWTGSDYYWVPGTWVQPPRVGFLWTPGYWGFVGGIYGWHAGYWGPHVGFYGGVNYGFGYVGTGFAGGRWVGNTYAYNTTVNNVNTTVVHNTYNTTIVNNVTINKVSYNGGSGGVVAAPTAQERAASQEQHVPLTAVQRQHVQEAITNPALAAKANGGHPTIAATPRAAEFTGLGVTGAHGATNPHDSPHPVAQANASRPAPIALPAAKPNPPGPKAQAPKPKSKRPPENPKRESKDDKDH